MIKQIAVVGSANCTDSIFKDAREIGSIIAEKGYLLITGGGRGVMEGACKGCKLAGGRNICILPTINKNNSNAFCDYIIPTGIGEARNFLVVQSADIIISISGSYGTLSELSIAKKQKREVLLYKPSNNIKRFQKDFYIINDLRELKELI